MKNLLSIILVLFCVSAFAQNIDEYNGKKIIAGKVIYKYKTLQLKSASVNSAKENVDLYLMSIGAKNHQQKFTNPKSANCENCVDLNQIYEFQYSADVPISEVLAKLNGMQEIEYAEPSYIGELLFTPNDTEYENGNLWILNTCKVLDAWDVEPGDTTVVVGIVDGGIDVIQKDLINKIAYNLADPINGIDDDGDGFADNYRGWDVADNDNNPSCGYYVEKGVKTVIEHGTHVSGIASAEVNNEFGSAGVGGKTKFIPVKVCPDGSKNVTEGYEGIVYAANHGCKVINCSWGDPGASQYGLDIVNYATYNCDALVVAAAGNSASTEAYYPASYSTVMSVGGTVAGDFVWSDSRTLGTHYNEYVDICAPAKGYYSLANNDKTLLMSGGTSFSTPIVSGAAAIVRSKYPEYSAIQVSELLKATADDLYAINSETKYKGMLGSGRLNLLNAVTNNSVPGLRIVDYKFENKNHQPYYFAKDTILVEVTIKNFLNDATNVSIRSVCEESFVRVIENCSEFETIAQNEEVTCEFSFCLLMTPPIGLETFFKFNYSADNDYSKYEYLQLMFNNYYYDFELGNIKSSATCDGSIAVYLSNMSQNGFSYKGSENCISQGGLVIAENQNRIYSRQAKTADFVSYVPPTIFTVDSCDLLIYSGYDAPDLSIDQIIYGWNDKDVVMYDYEITNLNDTVLCGLRIGMFVDWNILGTQNNRIWYVDSLQLTVVASVNPRTFYVGYMPLDYRQNGLYAFDVEKDAVYFNDGLNNTELWYMFNHSQTSVGVNSVSGANVAAFNYSVIDTILSKETQSVRYAMLAADSEKELYSLAYLLKQSYNPTIVIPDTSIIDQPDAIAQLTNADVRLRKKNGTYVVAYQESTEPISLRVFSAIGTEIEAKEISPENQSGEFSINLDKSGVYLVSVKRNGKITTFKVIK